MKKIYLTPQVETNETMAFEMMALSLQGGSADDSEVLSRNDEWDIWQNDDIEE